MNRVLTSSQIITQALGLAPEGVASKEEGCCAYCGATILPGDLCAPATFGPAFMDDLSLACRGSTLICGHCAPLLSASALMATSHGVFSSQGVRPFRKWADVSESLRNPPEPPFVMVYATANNQHMAWRARVNLSRDLFYVRVGLRDLRIRRKTLLDAIDASGRIAAYLGIEATAKSLPNPFATLSSDLKEDHGALRIKADQMVGIQAHCIDDMRLLRDLSLGESWGLRFLLSPNAGT